MSMFAFLWRRRKSSKHKVAMFLASKARLQVEVLEDRLQPSGSSISGFVSSDANNNGLYDAGEAPIANAPVQLRNAANNIIGSTTTDASGFYQFNQDATISQSPATITKT